MSTPEETRVMDLSFFDKLVLLCQKLISHFSSINTSTRDLNQLSDEEIVQYMSKGNRRAKSIIRQLLKKDSKDTTCFSSGVKYLNVLKEREIFGKDIVLLYYIFQKDISELKDNIVDHHLRNENCCSGKSSKDVLFEDSLNMIRNRKK